MRNALLGALAGGILSVAGVWAYARLAPPSPPAPAEGGAADLLRREIFRQKEDLASLRKEMGRLRGEIATLRADAGEHFSGPPMSEEDRILSLLRSRIEGSEDTPPAPPAEEGAAQEPAPPATPLYRAVERALTDILEKREREEREERRRREAAREAARLRDLAERLELTAFQTEQIQAAWDEADRKRRDLFAAARNGETERTFSDFREEASRIRQEEEAQIQRVLSASQYDLYVKYNEEDPRGRFRFGR